MDRLSWTSDITRAPAVVWREQTKAPYRMSAVGSRITSDSASFLPEFTGPQRVGRFLGLPAQAASMRRQQCDAEEPVRRAGVRAGLRQRSAGALSTTAFSTGELLAACSAPPASTRTLPRRRADRCTWYNDRAWRRPRRFLPRHGGLESQSICAPRIFRRWINLNLALAIA